MLEQDEISKLSTKIGRYEFWKNISDVAGVILLGFTLLFAILSNRLGVWLDKSKGELDKIEKRLSEQKIAKANAEAAKAIEGVVIAQERIAIANETSNKANAIAEEAKVKQVELEIDVSVAKRKQLEAEKELLLLKTKLQPRTLTVLQNKILKEFLANNPKSSVSIVNPIGDSEAQAYATELEKIFTESGWTVLGIQSQYIKTPVGLTILINNSKNVPLQTYTVVKAFNEARLSTKGVVVTSNVEINEVQIVVGTKE